ncbi:membrane-associated protein, putative [Bodo saltans]|uniref:Membrane-associated protein, putative n=1 Tax=Bodo saltans TaxID=75058 RepID=A0A0S4IX08_BODSA|nr:membrane-associated protein, putative [Bodo saltans]|eukprot:CUG01771.1 membrane-associated protein, putative [Bodo saltans]
MSLRRVVFAVILIAVVCAVLFSARGGPSESSVLKIAESPDVVKIRALRQSATAAYVKRQVEAAAVEACGVCRDPHRSSVRGAFFC